MTDFQLSPIENKGKRVLTTAQLAEAYETDSKVISNNFNRNADRYTEGKHFYRLTGDELKAFKACHQIEDNLKFAPFVLLWTEKGALLHAKSLNTDKAWEVYDYLVESYFTKKTADYSSLSPQLQYLISLEQKTKELEMAVQNTNRRLDTMCDTMQIKGVNWRKDTHSLVNRIATATETSPRDVYLDIYDEVEYRAGANLSVRLENLRNRLYDRGVSDSKINRLNYVDVIADDKKLTEIYIAIVKELAVRYIKPQKD